MKVLKSKELKNLFYIAINNLKRENKASSLGFVWLIIGPLVEALVYAILFGVLMPGNVEGISKLPWIVVGVFAWSFLSRAFLTGMNGFYKNKHLVTKIKFPLKNIPIIHIIMENIRYMFFWVILLPVLWYYHIFPTINYLWIIYAFIASYAFLLASTRLFSVFATLIVDVSKFIEVIFAMVFWASGVLYDINIVKAHSLIAYNILKYNPFTYLVNVWRHIFINKPVFNGDISNELVFWGLCIVMYLYGTYAFNKFKGDFADII